MSKSVWCAGIAAIAIGCSASEQTATDPQNGKTEVDVEGDGTAAPTATCSVSAPPGSTLQQTLLSPTAGAAVLSSDPAGEVAFTAEPYGQGVTKLDPAFAPIYAYPYGSVVAMDPKGNAYVAGSFSAPTDFGLGVLVPQGNADTFLVKLSPDGKVISAIALGVCGDGVQSIAIDGTEHVAISGAAMGTVIVDVTGKIVRQLPFAGYVAFDSRGNLVIAGAFAGTIDLGGGRILTTTGASDGDAFVVKIDKSGHVVFAEQIGDAPLPLTFAGITVATPRAQAIAGVATGPDDQIVLIGAFRYEIDLFGKILTVPPSFPSGQQAGTFLVEMASDGKLLIADPIRDAMNAELRLGGTVVDSVLTQSEIETGPGTPIAIDSHGDIVFSSNTIGDAQFPDAFPQLTKVSGLDASVLFSIGNGSGVSGYGHGVAVTSCDDVLWADSENTPSLFDSHTLLTKRAP